MKSLKKRTKPITEFDRVNKRRSNLEEYLVDKNILDQSENIIRACYDILNLWQVEDDERVLYAGDQSTMEEAFETMTVSLKGLKERYPEIPETELKERWSQWQKPWTGTLHLKEVHDKVPRLQSID